MKKIAPFLLLLGVLALLYKLRPRQPALPVAPVAPVPDPLEEQFFTPEPNPQHYAAWLLYKSRGGTEPYLLWGVQT